MTFEEKQELISEFNPDALYANGFEDALIGVVESSADHLNFIPVYDVEKMIDIFMKRDGMSEEEANEMLEYNTLGAGIGPNGPIYIRLFDNIKTLVFEDEGDKL